MFAKLVTNANTAVHSNAFFNNIVGVITGSITSNTQLDAATFNRAASQIITTVPSGWTLNDPQANLVGRTYNLPGCPPVVISSPWSDNGNYAKYLWLTPNAGGSAGLGATSNYQYFFNIHAIPMEYWSNTTKFATNSYVSMTTMNSVPVSNPGYAANSTFIPLNFGTRVNTDFISQMDVDITTGGTITIISASNTHLLVASYKGLYNPAFNNYFFLSEYSRDDSWSVAANGYPSWYFEMGSNTSGQLYHKSNISPNVFDQHGGALARIYNTRADVDHNWVDMCVANVTAGVATTNGNFGVVSRFVPWSFTSNTVDGPVNRPYTPRGLALAGQASMFVGNQNTYRDINKNITYGLAELKVVGVHAGTILNSNNIFLGGSINAVNPYVYLFKSQWNSIDEVSFGGDVWMNLILNNSGAGTTNASCVLVKEV